MNGYTIHRLSSRKFARIEKNFQPDTSTLFARIEGREVKEWQDYSERIAVMFKFPHGAEGYDGYNDGITDLGWLTEEGIRHFVLVITDYKSAFFKNDVKSKRILEQLFAADEEEWEVDGIYDKIPRTFTIYLVG